LCAFAAPAEEDAVLVENKALQRLAPDKPDGPGEADAPKPDKSRYNLFCPVPADLMRDFNTDRPDQTESPYTVDAGHYQIEWGLFSFTRDRRTLERIGVRGDNYTLGSANFKMGLANRIDLQFVFDAWEIQNERSRNAASAIVRKTRQGLGDLTTRLKINVFGNDGGKVALGVMPYLKVPTNQDGLGNHKVEGGLIVPVAVSLPRGWDMGFMTQLDAVYDGGRHSYHSEFFNTITFSHKIAGELDGYAEFAARVDTHNGSAWAGQVDCGMNYSFTKNVKLDWGVNIGVTRSADDVNPFVGLSVRF
jgi:hypothetical protein